MKRKMKLSHPGEILKMEIVEGRNLTIGKAAELLDLTRPTLSNILNGKAGVTPNVAPIIETVFGGSAKLWVRLQTSYDLAVADQSLGN
ncbi:HigA family addiction module antitoxin [Mongoliitalea daihaiensis]|uniref:HigA family addiction module antitoxin n=1 Tax=Mongoliitalea daihaiensis TaxID=2782006 RepID=UPI001F17016B|nr:HigA family addiction module antitoxin [Mongoliitalea daihaiensis]UJP66345.1 HigA family addiction module antidote protein [Mongoliitalea daihaiensis]